MIIIKVYYKSNHLKEQEHYCYEKTFKILKRLIAMRRLSKYLKDSQLFIYKNYSFQIKKHLENITIQNIKKLTIATLQPPKPYKLNKSFLNKTQGTRTRICKLLNANHTMRDWKISLW